MQKRSMIEPNNKRSLFIMKKQAGFTLIEISIVLIIIGLLLGGVLKGQELIENAKIKRVNNDFNGISAAVYSYLDRYNALPGDDPNALTRWATPTDAGDGDGIIAGESITSTATDESANVWDHLRRANLITGGVGVNPPVHAFNGTMGISDGYLALSGAVICMNNIPGGVAEIVDNQLDDGLPHTGVIRASTATLSDSASGLTTYDVNVDHSLCKQM
jgi:prepilin-type N-terminal cleavage/methylation domain-containing protein